MKTNIEVGNIIASYEDTRQMRDDMFDYILGVFEENRFNAYNIIKNSQSEDVICKLEDFFNFTLKYKDE